ncbi:MAG: tRNA glutamyl-Q(34) synthetase GluQRS [Humidesulfovibrio sp.]
MQRDTEQPARGQVRGRLAPSPTGRMHLGNAWAFLLAWLAARVAGGEVVLRMEDIDPERSRPELAAEILRDLRWLGLDWDEGPDVGGARGPFEQSGRLASYAAALARLERAGRIYPCFCTRKELRSLASAPHADDGSPIYPGTCRDLAPDRREAFLRQGRRPALRLRCDDMPVAFDDLLAGPQRLSLTDCGGDFAVRRSDGVFAYQLAVVLDDIAMGVTQVVRGDDILASTPRQIYLHRLLGAPIPRYAHLPLVLDHEGERLAKRHGSLTLAALRESGVSPRAVIGYLAWRAGLLEAPRPVAPQALVAGFDFALLPREPVRLPADIAEVLAALG